MGRPAKHSVDFKARVVLSVLRGEMTGAEAARRHGVSETSIGKWKEQFVAAGRAPVRRAPLMDRFLAGQLACLVDFTLLFAPTVNAYKRLRVGSFAPTASAWGVDNRRCAIRVVGRGENLRFEHRVGGGDVNPYLVVAAIIAAGLHGLQHDLELPAPAEGPPPVTAPRLPATLEQARERWLHSQAARAAFGADVVEHLARAAQAELDSFAASVTDWERERGFARL